MDEAERLAGRVAIVDHGRVIREGPPAELIAALGGGHVIEFETDREKSDLSKEQQESLRRLPSVSAVRREGPAWALTATEPHLTIPALLAWLDGAHLPLARLATHQATLEDVFVSLTGRHLRDD
jgi:ABC-2 type transport system ATP-binding protein